VGTDNPALLEDPLYLGYRAPRLRGQAYDDVLEAFVEAVGRVFPGAIVQWEDFKQHNALRVLERYRHRLPTFNDDVQGTGGVTLAGLLVARAARGGLAGERILFLGAGAAALGIARMVSLQLASEGVAPDAIGAALSLMDSKGLIHDGREIADDQRAFSMSRERFAALGLDTAAACDPVAVARAVRPTILIGTTGTPGTFSEALIQEVARHDPEPVILPLTNPGDKCEARPEQILAWTEGRALVASGSPFPSVAVPGRGDRTIAQANNVFVFPGVGLGAIVAGTREVTDEAFIIAARELAARVTPERLAAGGLYPPIAELRGVSRAIAIAVVRHFRDAGYGRHLHDDEIEPAVDRAIWWPDYLPYVPA
jgi:malic enzyme